MKSIFDFSHSNIFPNLIETTVVSGKRKRQDELILRIAMISTDSPFDFNRLQFPVCLAFAITTNKARGQSLNVAGLNLQNS